MRLPVNLALLLLAALLILASCSRREPPADTLSIRIRGQVPLPSGGTNAPAALAQSFSNAMGSAQVTVTAGCFRTNVPLSEVSSLWTNPVLAAHLPTPAGNIPSPRPGDPLPSPPPALTNSPAETSITSPPVAAHPVNPTITVLCYHQFNRPRNPYSVSGEEFRRHLQAIKDQGYTVVPLSHVLDFWQGKRKDLPEKSMVITIDDGFRSVYDVAFPLLREFNYPWVFYVYTDFVGSGAGAVSWDQLKEMHAHGMEIGSHSKSHPLLTRRGKKGEAEYQTWLQEEIAGSKKIIEENMGMAVRSFAYPYGGHNDAIRKMCADAGYEAMLNVLGANNFSGTSPHRINRFVITRDLTFDKIMAMATQNTALLLAETSPAQGAVLDERRPRIQAVLAPSQQIVSNTVALSLKGAGRLSASYDPATRTISAQPDADLPPGPQFLSLRAKDPSNGKWLEATWFFQVNGSELPPESLYEKPGHSPQPTPATGR